MRNERSCLGFVMISVSTYVMVKIPGGMQHTPDTELSTLRAAHIANAPFKLMNFDGLDGFIGNLCSKLLLNNSI